MSNVYALLFVLSYMISGFMAPINLETPQLEGLVARVDSWRTGERQIEPRQIVVRLDNKDIFFSQIIKDSHGQDAYLITIKNKLLNRKEKGAPFEEWQVSLHEIKATSNRIDHTVDKNLLLVTLPGETGGHVLHTENAIASFSPLTNPMFIKGMAFFPNKEKPQFGIIGYPITTTRIIKIERFYCVIKASSFEISNNNLGEFSFLKLAVEFTNIPPQ